MILPSKFLPAERSLIVIGGEILALVQDSPRSASEIWDHVRAGRSRTTPVLTFDWFALAISLLFAIGSIETKDGVVALRAERRA